MAEGMARADNKRAATAYSIDPQSVAGLEMAVAELTERRPIAMIISRALETGAQTVCAPIDGDVYQELPIVRPAWHAKGCTCLRSARSEHS